MNKWKWVWANHPGGERLYDVGILPDGTLHNPRGYPDDLVRTAVFAADARQHERRSVAAKKAGATRKRRQEKQVLHVAQRWAAGHQFGPSGNCVLCGRGLTDAASIQRGIGSECWQELLSAVEKIRPVARLAV